MQSRSGAMPMPVDRCCRRRLGKPGGHISMFACIVEDVKRNFVKVADAAIISSNTDARAPSSHCQAWGSAG